MRLKGSTRSRRALTTVLFTDVVASTEHATTLGDRRFAELIAKHHRVVRQQLKAHSGREIDTAGDGFFASFREPDDAISCALDIVPAIEALGIQIRAGIHVGEVEQLGGKLGGIAVHVAARILGAAQPGQVVVSSILRELSRGSQFDFEDLGMHSLKGVAEELRLYAAHSRLPVTIEAAARAGPPLTTILTRMGLLITGAAAATVVLLVAAFALTRTAGDQANRSPPPASASSQDEVPSTRPSAVGAPPTPGALAVERADRDTVEAIYLLDWDPAYSQLWQAEASRLTPDHCRLPAWSPDGDQLAYVCSEPPSLGGSPFGATEALLINVGEGMSDPIRMSDFGKGLLVATDVAWTPDGDLVVASALTSLAAVPPCRPECGLYFHGALQSGFYPVGQVTSVDVSPTTGELIFVGLNDASQPALFSMQDEGSQPEAIAIGRPNLEPRDVAWSPDGTRVALTMFNGSSDDLYLLDVASGALTPLLTGKEWDSFPAWVGNDRLVFASDRDGTLRQLWQLEVGASQPTQLTHDDRHEYLSAAWRP